MTVTVNDLDDEGEVIEEFDMRFMPRAEDELTFRDIAAVAGDNDVHPAAKKVMRYLNKYNNDPRIVQSLGSGPIGVFTHAVVSEEESKGYQAGSMCFITFGASRFGFPEICLTGRLERSTGEWILAWVFDHIVEHGITSEPFKLEEFPFSFMLVDVTGSKYLSWTKNLFNDKVKPEYIYQAFVSDHAGKFPWEEGNNCSQAQRDLRSADPSH